MANKVTIKDVAELSGTSKTTVSFYLNGKFDKMSQATRDRIEKVIRETNFEPSVAARSLNAKSSHLIGVIIGDITNSFSNQIFKGIDDYADSMGYQLIVGNSNYDNKREVNYVNKMIAMGVDGFIIQPTAQFDETAEVLKNSGKKIVYFDSQLSSTDNSMWVKTNNYEAVLEATEKMIKKGYEEFILVTGDPKLLSVRAERYRGFVDTAELAGKKATMIVVNEHTSAQHIEKELFEHIDKTKKTLVFAANGWCLPKVYLALKKHDNLIPQNIGLLGFDSQEWTEFSSPTITTIVQPAYEEGTQACKILVDAIEELGKELPNQILRSTLKEGQSTNI